MKALLELASLFQAIPKPSGPLGKGRGERKKSLLSALLELWDNVLQHHAAAHGSGSAHTLNPNSRLAHLPTLAGRAQAGHADHQPQGHINTLRVRTGTGSSASSVGRQERDSAYESRRGR